MKSLAFVCAFFVSFTVFSADKPNIILIYTDDHGWPDIGVAGINDDLKTPHIDALAASGARATNGYSSAPQCVPSRAGLLSGRAQNRFGLESNAETLEGFDEQFTIADRLKTAGYATGQIGKWHLGKNNRITDHGFDDVYSKNANRPCFANFTLEGETIDMKLVDDGLFHLDACSKAALTFIKRHADDPFFLYLAYRAPHVPLDAPRKYLDRFPDAMPERRRQALAMISAMDDGVGEIVADLKARGLSEKTLIFYIGDNGAPLKIHKVDAPGGGPGWDGSLNEPMNGEKGMLAEGGIRVPYVMSWPGTITAGQVFDEPVTTLDVAATAVEEAGLKLDDKLDGVNLIPFLNGKIEGAPHESLTWRWIAQSAIREGKWKLLIGGEREYLFDLNSDPGELKNLLSVNPDVADRLRTKLSSWADELKPPGLAAGKMSVTWERYFDHYLDGKVVEEATAKKREVNTQGWISRNADLTTVKGALRVTPKGGDGKQGPFLVRNQINLDGKIAATLTFKTAAEGNVGIAWRTEGQKDFSADQTVMKAIKPGPDLQRVTIDVPAKGKTIHVRLLLPNGVVDVTRIAFEDSASDFIWDFAKPRNKK